MTPPAVHIVGGTTRDRPFQRINIPNARLVKVVGQDIFISPINGQGYDCGCRSTDDYDGNVGKDIGDKLADQLEKVVPLFAAAKATKDGFAKLLGKIPGIGKKLSDLVDGFDPLKSLLEFIGEKLDALLIDSLVRSIPAWVPVFRNSDKADQLIEAEVEGVLVRSHQRHDGVPYSQWHIWYDWTFLVAPVGNTRGIMGLGNTQRTRNDASIEDDGRAVDARRYERGWLPFGNRFDDTISCEWDIGAIGDVPGGPFLNDKEMAIDWGWPMAGQFFWASGRNVYDCSHATSDEKNGKNVGLHLNQLRPLKAMATQRWEGFLFKENRQAVPAAQFTFFASKAGRSGGNFKFDTITDTEYEFVVQLPPGGGIASDDPYSIGSTNHDKLNTVDIGRRLLVSVDTTPFAKARLHHNTAALNFTPVVTPLVVKDGDGVPTHARVRFPLKTQLADEIENFGAIISLGWHDPSGSLAKTVHKVTVTFTKIFIPDAKDLTGPGEWSLNFGANGRWFQREFLARDHSVHDFTDLPTSIVLLLDENDTITVATHGLERDTLDDEFRLPDTDPGDPEVPPKDAPKSKFDAFMLEFLSSRKLRLSKEIEVPTGVDKDGTIKSEKVDVPFIGDIVDWEKDMDQPMKDRKKEDDDKKKDDDKKTPIRARASEVARALFLRTARRLFDDNEVLGLVDPNIFAPTKIGLGRQNDSTDAANPLLVKDLLAEVGLGGTKSCEQTAYEMTQLGRFGTLGYDEKPVNPPEGVKILHKAKVDYIIHYTVKIEAQPKPTPDA